MLYTFLERRLYYIPTNTCLPHLNAEIYFVQIRRVWNIFCLDQEDSKYILNISYSNQVDLKYIWNISCSDQEGARDTVSRRPQYDQHPPWALLVSFHLYQYPFVCFDDIYMICIPLSHGILTGFHLAEGYPYTQFLEYPLLVLQVTSPISTQINVNLLPFLCNAMFDFQNFLLLLLLGLTTSSPLLPTCAITFFSAAIASMAGGVVPKSIMLLAMVGWDSDYYPSKWEFCWICILPRV